MKVWTQEQAIKGAPKAWRTLETVGEAVMTDSVRQQDRPHTRVLTLEIPRLLNATLMRSNVADDGQEEVMLVTFGLPLSEHGLEISELVLRSCGPSHFIPHHRLASCYLCLHPKSARLLIYLNILISIYRFISRDNSACVWLSSVFPFTQQQF